MQKYAHDFTINIVGAPLKTFCLNLCRQYDQPYVYNEYETKEQDIAQG